MKKGVAIRAPFSVEIGPEVSLERISGQGVTLCSGTKIYGARTLISAGVTLGQEAPVTVLDCHLGPQVQLQGGFFQSAVFLDKVNIASGAHVRECSLLEEEAKAGHTVGLKQTLLFPFVTLGSLINFCDCLMAGGTSREDHSEVGSSYVHFNYTPQQDKATPSLIGDVPRGVMVDQPPVFLGGQGGLVGPLRIDYGTVITAGTVWRKDSFGAKLLHGGEGKPLSHTFQAGAFGDVRRKFYNNILYVANIIALCEWYIHVRQPFFLQKELGRELYEGALACLEGMIRERLRRLRGFVEKIGKGAALQGEEGKGERDVLRQQRELVEKWPAIEKLLSSSPSDQAGRENRLAFLEAVQPGLGPQKSYLEVIKNLDEEARQEGTLWLQRIVDDITIESLKQLPSFASYVT